MKLSKRGCASPHPNIRNAAHRLCLALLALLLGAPALAAPEATPMSLDRIVAVVNDEVITALELEQRMKTVQQQLQKQGTPLPPRNVLEKQLLERLIADRVQLQFARESGVRVEDSQLDKTLQRIAEENKLTPDALRQALENDGIIFSRFREDIRNEIIISRLREREVDNRVTVTDGEIDQQLETLAQQGMEDEYQLAHILVRTPEQASPEQVEEKRRRAEQALAQLNAGADFGQVAASFSDAQDALEGGRLGWRSGGQVPTLFANAIRPLQVGQLSGVLRSPNGFHIIKLLDKRGKSLSLIVQQSLARHILVKTTEIVSENDARQRLVQLKERLDNGADFAELARLHSEDGSAAKGGDLGWLSPGDTVPEFEKAMNALALEKISEPVRSPFGWHLIQVLERRTEDIGKERQRLLARQEIRMRKADESYQEWLRQLRDRAYVEYRLEEK